MHRFALIVSIFLLTIFSTCLAQDVVVSEYLNDVAQDREWSEFLVIKDNANLVGYIFTDNRGTQDQIQSGPKLLDIPLWRNVRAGTIIVIHHDALPAAVKLDTNAADGYLEFSEFDTRFFRIVNVEGASSSFGMNINVDRDFVQVLRADSTHVHGLGHGRPLGPSYLNTPNPKVNLDTANMGNTKTVGIVGRTILAYSSGVGRDSVSNSFNISRGLPNLVDNAMLLAGVKNVNHRFWRETREPKFVSSPVVTVVAQTATKHTIEWTQVTDANPKDSTTGYLILRDTLNFASFPANGIVDGSQIIAGSRIGSALVLALQPTAVGNTYNDSLNIVCGMQYTYRVHAYRYKADDFMSLAQTADTTARGRQYTENTFAQSAQIFKAAPGKPLISSMRNEMCPGDTLTITSNVTSALKFEWTVNGVGVSIGGSTSIIVREPGTYRLRIYVDGGCSAESDAIVIGSLPAPTVAVNPVGTQTICNGDTLLLTSVTDGASYQWLKSGVTIIGATQKTYRATAVGDYQVRIASALGCPGISQVVRIRVPDVRFSFVPNTLDFGNLGQCQNSTTMVTELVNDGAEPITISQFVAPTGFVVTSPAPGFMVPVGQRQVVRILFAPPSTGVFAGNFSFTATPCGIVQTLTVKGQRTLASATLDKAGVNFGAYTICPSSDIRPDSAIRVTNSGTSAITISTPLVNPPFYLLTQFTTEQLAAGASKLISIQYRPFAADLDRGVIQEIGFPFSSSDCNDTLKATLEAASFKPKVAFDTAALDLGLVLSCNPAIDTSIDVTNTSLVPVTVESSSKGIANGGIEVVGTPITISPGTTKSIRIRTTVAITPGLFSVTDTLNLSPCNIKTPIQFTGRVVAPKVSISPTSLTFGSIDRCIGQTEKTLDVTVTVTGLGGLRANISTVDVSAPFSTTAKPNNFIVDTETFTVTYRPLNDGSHIDTLILVVGPCFDTVRCIVQGSRTTPGTTSYISNNSFGTVLPGTSKQEKYVVKNSGTSTITVEPLQGIVAPWIVASTSKPVPTTLQPADSVVFTLEYQFAGYDRKDTLTFQSVVSGLCADTTSNTITGATTSRGVLSGVLLQIADTSTATIGSVVNVPVSLHSTVPLDSSVTTQLLIYISYNGSVIYPTSLADFGKGLSGSVVNVGTQKSMVTLSSASPIKDTGHIFSLVTKVYLGSELFSPINIDSIISNGMVINGVPGKVTVIGDCSIETKTIALGKPPSAILTGSTTTALEFDVVTNTDHPLTVELYAVDGRLIGLLLNAQVKPGEHHISTTLPSTVTGAVIVVFKHGRFLQSIPVMLR
ncbi:MAG: hypothetical protein HQ472_07640 [Ignavibacteria bacterium]|nr:hypothetical protein [Ignavibacteria bacterium]